MYGLLPRMIRPMQICPVFVIRVVKELWTCILTQPMQDILKVFAKIGMKFNKLLRRMMKNVIRQIYGCVS